ncbi:MAG: hypothetical protein A3C85_01310 [Candidatus Doudnabacteria bacterium RIFCSPHIGHO2_02_FULL_48_21]|uniref:Tubulin/FtsZ GTPase domain-containing protein n=1 Tax=Candidatus Doudnabacteria bacterium RIFCSPLOWO2_02_FULL_48_13 TaxID=1817845 RepID=A0A1F5Q9X7_9BACT|nr:MAG: hypothetical protein A3K05_04355 [Candidatus Doudnabacteria bacterium RIFCSPHIGHO2_01_48_18]OGE79595.1 MAG: hypothetical protein A2668_03365 [Candidatus Doudnabacteria bacterium RIFCSPHIGHO2_01_FULL_48_180]OGE91122.1 MAG: hypothetical protein A3F44_02250 [Candidatus Doudnabacteria bacterium RIFCSPHIGHO2_12_FULL_47_25]OGE93812.1 MAG: hypothetical protein A3C85_01310 [Candidatus Doudnabacteria bacterium RIFCSPHIGHO2_02_FULL_48_21]OGE97998.1 MAG: hypothetical protein A3A83_00895 [Candidatu
MEERLRIKVFGSGNVGVQIAAIAARILERRFKKWAASDPSRIDALKETIQFVAGNTEHATLEREKSTARLLQIIRYGDGRMNGAGSAEEGRDSFLTKSVQNEFQKLVLALTQIIVVIVALGGNTGRGTLIEILKLILAQTDDKNRKKIIPFALTIRPSVEDGSSWQRVEEADVVFEQMRKLGIPYLEMCTDAADTSGQEINYDEFDRQIEDLLDTLITIFSSDSFGKKIDGRRLAELYQECGPITMTRIELPIADLANAEAMKAHYEESWKNRLFTEQQRPLKGAIRVIRTPRNVGAVNAMFARKDEERQSALENRIKIHQMNSEALSDDKVVVVSLRFHEAFIAASQKHKFALFEHGAIAPVEPIDNVARFKRMRDFPALPDWIEAMKLENAHARVAELPEEIMTYDEIMKNLPGLAEIGNFGKGLPEAIHHRMKAIIKKNFKLTKCVIRSQEGPVHLSHDLTFHQLTKITGFRELTLTEEALKEIEIRSNLCRALGEEFLQTLDFQEDPKFAVAAATGTDGKNTSTQQGVGSSIKKFLGRMFEETKSDFDRLNLR